MNDFSVFAEVMDLGREFQRDDTLLEKKFHYYDTFSKMMLNIYEVIFKEIKRLICIKTTLSYYDPHKPFIIQVYASSRGFRAVLLQDSLP